MRQCRGVIGYDIARLRGGRMSEYIWRDQVLSGTDEFEWKKMKESVERLAASVKRDVEESRRSSRHTTRGLSSSFSLPGLREGNKLSHLPGFSTPPWASFGHDQRMLQRVNASRDRITHATMPCPFGVDNISGEEEENCSEEGDVCGSRCFTLHECDTEREEKEEECQDDCRFLHTPRFDDEKEDNDDDEELEGYGYMENFQFDDGGYGSARVGSKSPRDRGNEQ